MPRKKRKTREEKAIESFSIIDEEDLKKTVEKRVHEGLPKEEILKNAVEKMSKDSQLSIKTIHKIVEKSYSKPSRKELESVEKPKRKTRRKTARKKTTKKNTEFSIPKVKLKSSGYELIITEKPQAAVKIASALGKPIQKNYQKVPYYEITRNGKKIVVACAVGHLFTLTQNSSGSNFPRFDISWVPNFYARKKDFTKRYYDALKKLIKDASSLTVATDYDIEGEVIGLNVVRYIGGQKDASRMKFSTLTKLELEKAYKEKYSSIDWGQAIAGETRHYLDWFYGINLSRALMNAIKSTGKFKIMSVGRVQGPALKLIADREKEIKAFKPEPFWQIFITIENNKHKLELKHVKDIFNKNDLNKFENLVGKTAIAETKKREERLPPGPPFNLTGLQTESYRLFGITPSKTLQIAQSLYLAGFISYPRTSSQKLPPSINYKEILKKIVKKKSVEKLLTRDKPIEGAKSDPAHPSIYPTGQEENLSGLGEQEQKIYKLIVARFLALFCEDAIIDRKTIRAKVLADKKDFSQQKGERSERGGIKIDSRGSVKNHQENLLFTANGAQIRKKSWLDIYPKTTKEEDLPDIEGEVKIVDSRIDEKETQPPRRYSPASIVTELEKRNLGTKATRASILETLYDRGYVKDTSIKATPLGISLIDSLEKHSPIITDEQLTREFEEEMEKITESKNKAELQKRENQMLEKAKDTITKISKDMKENQKEIGQELVQANVKNIEQLKKENTLIQCPTCKKGNLIINYSKKNKRYFVACDAYPKCTQTYTVPPNGTIKKANKVCEKCNWPMLMRLQPRKKPWIFCFNPNCEVNRERVEEYERNKKD